MRTTWKLFGFALAMFLVAQAADAQVLKVTAQSVKLRTEPTTASAVVTTVTQGTMLEVVEVYGSWYMVDVLSTGEVGYIHRVLVEVVDDQASAAPAPVRTTTPPPAAPQPPPARQPTAAPPAPSTPPPADSYARTQSMEQPPDNGVDLTLWGGLVGGLGGTALGGGGALGFFIGGPAAEIEVGGDYSPGINGADVRVTSPFVDSNAFSVGTSALFFAHGSFTYNFHLETSRAVPYASGGLVYMRTSEETTFFDNSWSASITGSAMAPQFGGGIKLPIGGGDTYFRGDIRFYLFDGAKATRVNAGVTF